ncbi:MAG TPA: molybdopterin-binding oxidoreductase [Actinobacteria bacterium]|nr:molybdopterin-binding oxidoreductase [Actinomycetota bacterium]
MDPDRTSRIAGIVAVALSLGLTELFAGLAASVPSAIAAVGAVVVSVAPGWLVRFAIALFGTADKAVLGLGIVLVALGIGAAVGARARRHPRLADAAFFGFALVGIAAQLLRPEAAVVPVVVSTAAAAGLGRWVLSRLPSTVAEGPDVVDVDRRRFLGIAGGVAAGALAAAIFGRTALVARSRRAATDVVLPEPIVRAVEVGPRHRFDLEGLTPIVVDPPDFYRIDTALVVPAVDVESWTLRVLGMVERPLELSYADLLAMPQVERHVTIACVSNEVGGDLVGNAKWQGVRLAEVLEMAGVAPEATQVVGRSVDGWTAGFPTEVVFDGRDPLIVVGMNGRPLPRRHGHPARLIVPGLYGYVSATKWLAEIELTTWEGFDAYWIPRGWAKEGPIKTQSRIDRPAAGERVPGAVVAAGVAWAPTRGIARVEVQLDEGPWREAELTEPLSADAWVQWRLPLEVTPGRHRLRVRATDGDGVTQPEERTPPDPDGATGWHTIEFTAG